MKKDRKEYYKQYYLKNKNKPEVKEKRRNYFNNKYQTDKQYKIRKRLSNQFRMAIKKYMKKNKISISKNKNINYKVIIEHLKPFPKNIKDYHIDHIIPLDFFDLTDEENLKKAWNPVNFQWLKKSDNISKRNIIDFDKYPKQKIVWDKLRL